MKFTFAPESQPLDGYTIKRAIYRGGFGEVYQAVSASGREVALKLIQNNAQVELRGIQHCLNLSHPNLVMIFNVLEDHDHDHWIVMEYISGPTLDAVLDEHPKGMPIETAVSWMKGLAAGIDFLHGRGIVHRDLKPANLFLQNGIVKIGDVGLSKMIGPSQRSAQTQSVGTVYYMAPEVANGSYGKEVDLYAAGVILYEILTGDVPFDGESTGEILLKHLTARPDLSRLPAKLRPVIAKALEKSPQARYRSMGEFANAFEQAAGLSKKGSPPPPLPVFSSNPSDRGQPSKCCGTLSCGPLKGFQNWGSCSSTSNQNGHHSDTGSEKGIVIAIVVVGALLIVNAVKEGASYAATGSLHGIAFGKVFGFLIPLMVLSVILICRRIDRKSRSIGQASLVDSVQILQPQSALVSKMSAERVVLMQKISTACGMACLAGLFAVGMSSLVYLIVERSDSPQLGAVLGIDPASQMMVIALASVIAGWGVSFLRFLQTHYSQGKLSMTTKAFVGAAVGVIIHFAVYESRILAVAGSGVPHRGGVPVLHWLQVLYWSATFVLINWTRQTAAKRPLRVSLWDLCLNLVVMTVLAMAFSFGASYGMLTSVILTGAVQLAAPWKGHNHRAGVLVSDSK